MRSGRVRVGTLFLLLVGTLLVGGPRSRADISETVYLPWVPNGDSSGALGAWYGRVELQNPSTSTCAVQVSSGTGTGDWTAAVVVDLKPFEQRDLSPEEIGLGSPGGVVMLEASGCRASAAVKQASQSFADPPWSHGTAGVTGYTGVPLEDTVGSPNWILPIVQTNNGWDSFIRVSNVAPTFATRATIDIFPYQNIEGDTGAFFSETVTIPAGATRSVDLLDAVAQTGFVGFARISSTGSVVAEVQREKASADLAMIDVATGYPTDLASLAVAGTYALQAPIIFNAYNGWNTGINLANANDATAHVTISYPGAGRPDDLVTMLPYSSEFVYTPGNAPNQAGFTGNAVIYADAPIAAAVDEVKYSTNDAISYSAVPALSDTAAVPIVFKQSQDGRHNDNSGINISNGGDTQTRVAVSVHDQSGLLAGGPFELTIPAHASNFIYLASAAVPAGTMGSAIVTSLDGANIVVVSNDVSYDVDGGGSVVFNAPSSAGLYQIGGAP